MGRTLLILNAELGTDEQWTPGLERLGYTVLYAEEPGQALVHIRQGEVDCVLINGGDKYEEILQFVQDFSTEGQPPPFVLVSASPAAPTYSAKLGAAAFVPKPCCTSELEHVLMRMSV